MAWEVEATDEFVAWYRSCSDDEQDRIEAAIEKLEELGPALRRPFVGNVQISRHSQMKELIPLGGHLRIFFAFDPRRVAIVLVGGDKSDRWVAFYREYVARADDLYDEHLRTLRAEGLIP
jgi:hypothetical protein